MKKATTKPTPKPIKDAYRKFKIKRLTNIAMAVVALLGVSVLGLVRTHSAFQAGQASPPPSIAANCSVNVAAQLQAWINSVPDGSTMVFPAGACYRIDDKLRFVNRNNLTLDGQGGATFKAVTSGLEYSASDARTRDQFLFQGSNNITVKRLIVYGANPNAGMGDAAYVAALEAQHAFDILGSNNVLVDSVQAYDVYGDFVYVGQNDSNVTVQNSTFARNGRQGISVTYARNTVIQNNSISNTRRSTFDLEPSANSWTIDGVTLKNNRIGAGRLNFIASAGACAVIKNLDFEGNVLTSKTINIQITSPGPPGCTTRRSNVTIKGNSSDVGIGNPSAAMFIFADIDNTIIDGNTLPAQNLRGMYIARFMRSNNASVTNNTVLYGKGALYSDSLSKNLCWSGNKIGNPLTLEPASPACVDFSTPPPNLPPPPPIVIMPNPPPIPPPEDTSGGDLSAPAAPTTATSASQPSSAAAAAAKRTSVTGTAVNSSSPPVAPAGSKSAVLDAVTNPSAYVEKLPDNYVQIFRIVGISLLSILFGACVVAEFFHFRKTHLFYRTIK